MDRESTLSKDASMLRNAKQIVESTWETEKQRHDRRRMTLQKQTWLSTFLMAKVKEWKD